MAGGEWWEQPRLVEVTRRATVRAAPDAVWALVSRPDAALLFPGTAMVVPVPTTARSCVVELTGEPARVRVQEHAADETARVVRTLDLSTGWTVTVQVEAHRIGSRVTLEQSGQVPRGAARGLTNRFEALAVPWLDQVTAVATGFRASPQQRPDLLAALLTEPTATLRGSRTLPAPPAEIWQMLVWPEDGRRFWTGESQVRAGAWSWHVVGDGPVRAHVREVTSAVPDQRLSLRSVAGSAHHHRVHWQLEQAGGGTLVTYDHECGASHVGLPPVVDLSLDQLAQRLADR